MADKKRTGDDPGTPSGDEPVTPNGGATDTAAVTTGATPERIAEGRTDAPVSIAENIAPPQEEMEAAGDGYVSALPVLTTGDAGPLVMELAVALQAAGYENAVAVGRSPAILDDALMETVRRFQADADHDPAKPEEGATGPSPFRHADRGVVDARTWERLLGRPVTVGRQLETAGSRSRR